MKTIATHNGPFHADDVLAVACLKVLHPEASLVRTRDKATLAEADIRVDVGGVYDPDNNTFDHHFKGSPVGPLGVRLSSAGMVWQKFGPQIVDSFKTFSGNFGYEHVDSASVASRVYEDLFAAVDAADNGEGNSMLTDTVESFTFAHAVSNFNPNWDDEQTPEMFMVCFESAVNFATKVLYGSVKRALGVALAEDRVKEAIAGDPEIVVLENFMPWHEALVPNTQNTKYVVFPNPEGTWMVQCVPPELGSFGQRKPLPEAWAGLRDEAMASLTGVASSVFCHPNRFICGAKDREGAMTLARLALSSES